jgi:hypothetical protein
MFGKSSTAILDYILACDTFDPAHCWYRWRTPPPRPVNP